MSLSTFFTAKFNRGYVKEVINLFEHIISSPLVTYIDDKIVNINTSNFWELLPNENTKPLYMSVESIIPDKYGNIVDFNLEIEYHNKTENDNYANGYDITLRTFIDLPYKGNKKYFEPFIILCKAYGYSSYTITSEYTDDTIEETFDSGTRYSNIVYYDLNLINTKQYLLSLISNKTYTDKFIDAVTNAHKDFEEMYRHKKSNDKFGIFNDVYRCYSSRYYKNKLLRICKNLSDLYDRNFEEDLLTYNIKRVGK